MTERQKLIAAYRSTFSGNQEPYNRLPYKSSKEKICSWIIDAMELKEQGEYYYCGLWSKIKLLDLKCAVAALWRSEKMCQDFCLRKLI